MAVTQKMKVKYIPPGVFVLNDMTALHDLLNPASL